MRPCGLWRSPSPDCGGAAMPRTVRPDSIGLQSRGAPRSLPASADT
jgi:hypothetical protein